MKRTARSQAPRLLARLQEAWGLPGGPTFTIHPPVAHAYACRRCKRWHREDREPRLYAEHCVYQLGTVTYAIPIPVTGALSNSGPSG